MQAQAQHPNIIHKLKEETQYAQPQIIESANRCSGRVSMSRQGNYIYRHSGNVSDIN